jgi:hypothetical protein
MEEAKPIANINVGKLAEFRKKIFVETLGEFNYSSIYSCFKKMFSDSDYEYIILKVRKTWSLYCALKPIFDDDEYFDFDKKFIINDRAVDVFADKIKDSIRRGKKVLLVDDCTNTGSTLSLTLSELSTRYDIGFDKFVLHSFFVNSDIYFDGDGESDKNCCFDVKKREFRFYPKELNDENKPFIINESNARVSVKLYEPKLINFEIVSEVRRTSNMMLKSIHEGVSPYVSYLPCFFLEKNTENADLFEAVIEQAQKYGFNLIDSIEHDFLYKKNMKQEFYVIPISDNIEDFRKYIKICTADGADYLYIAPYVFLPDDLEVEKLALIYNALFGDVFPISGDPAQMHRRLKHFLSILVFKEFCKDKLKYRINDISNNKFSTLMAEIFGEFEGSIKIDSPYVRLANESELSEAETAIENILGHDEKYVFDLYDPPDKDDKESIRTEIEASLEEAYNLYKNRVGK